VGVENDESGKDIKNDMNFDNHNNISQPRNSSTTTSSTTSIDNSTNNDLNNSDIKGKKNEFIMPTGLGVKKNNFNIPNKLNIPDKSMKEKVCIYFVGCTGD
jgi:hypothetical protein